jgi:Domain of unknown function (DUF4440)
MNAQQALETVARINEEISAAEDRGDARALDGLLSPVLAFRRANGQVVGREEFLSQAKAGGSRKTVTRSILLLGHNRAFVTCDVTMPVDGEEKTFENARLFVRTDAGDWKLLGWANESA